MSAARSFGRGQRVWYGPESIPESEFATRIGASREDAEAKLVALSELL